jgi:glycosyltransferase involved in cell wall biosynthesis
MHALAPARYGGLESVIQALAAGQQAAGHDVHATLILDPADTQHPLAIALAEGGVTVHVIEVAGRRYVSEARRFAAICRSVRPHVVHTHGYRSDIVEGTVARWLGIARVSTVHGFVRLDGRSRLYENIQRRVLGGFDAVVAVSRPLVDELVGAGVDRARIHLIRNAWRGASPDVLTRNEARAALRLDADIPVLGWVGRVSPEKGADILLQALDHLGDVAPLQLSIIGDGRDRSELEHTVRASPGHRVVWHGALSDASRYFPAFDAFVLSSRTEGTPIVLFEAMAAGTPIVATRVGGVPDVVSTDEAELVPSEDPEALAAGLRRVLTDPTLARERAIRARNRLDVDWRLDTWVDAHTALYKQVAP